MKCSTRLPGDVVEACGRGAFEFMGVFLFLSPASAGFRFCLVWWGVPLRIVNVSALLVPVPALVLLMPAMLLVLVPLVLLVVPVLLVLVLVVLVLLV
jgi:hypothetical protein